MSAAIPIQTVRCTADEARTIFAAFPAKAKRSLPGHALSILIDLIGPDRAAALPQALAQLFPDEPIDKARRRLTTEIANRVYVDDTGTAPLKIVQTRKGVEPALVWLERVSVTDTRGLTEVGERYAAESFVSAEATQKTSAEIIADIADSAQAISQKNTIESDDTYTDTDRSSPSATFTAARHHAISNLVKPHNAANDSLRGSNLSSEHFTDTEATQAEGFSAFPESPKAASQNTVNALEAMLAWAADSRTNAPKLLALLGDYGTGKTSHALQFSRVLNGDVPHANRPVAALSALHIDLAYLRGAPGLAQLNVTQIIALVIEARGLQKVLNADIVVREVREGHRILVYDGLDELMQTDHAQLHSVFRQLLQVLEPDPVSREPSRARLIVSCRTHYFRDLTEQHEFFNTRLRHSVTRKDYLCLYLLPWKAATVRDYLNRRLSADEATALSDTIANTYNLEELASRPVLLAMMCEQVGEVLRLREAGGGAVTASTLYAQTVAMWVRRDDEKHVLHATHKPVLMGALACAMWNENTEFWEADRLDRWLRRTVDALFPGHYSPQQTSEIQDDLRTATFIVRPRQDEFTFAHRSFMEFFLARHLVTLLDMTEVGEYELRGMLPRLEFSVEALNFLRELMLQSKGKLNRRVDRIWNWLSYDVDSNLTVAFSGAPPAHRALFGIAMSLELSCKSSEIKVNLRRLDFRLQVWNTITCPNLDLRGADLRGLRAVGLRFGQLLLDGAKVSTTVFRDCALSGAIWGNVERQQIMFRLSGQPSGEGVLPSKVTRPASLKATPFWNDSHKIGMALIPFSELVVVTTEDSAKRVTFWDARSGRMMLQYRGVADIAQIDNGNMTSIRLPKSVVEALIQKELCVASDFFEDRGQTNYSRLNPVCLRLYRPSELSVDETRVCAGLKMADSGRTRYFVHGRRPSTACFDPEGRLVDYDEEAANTWLRYMGNGYPQPVEAAWLELDEFGRSLGPKKVAS